MRLARDREIQCIGKKESAITRGRRRLRPGKGSGKTRVKKEESQGLNRYKLKCDWEQSILKEGSRQGLRKLRNLDRRRAANPRRDPSGTRLRAGIAYK